MHVHLDPIGGVAGDMFVAALLDVWPELASELPALLTMAGLPETVRVQCHCHVEQGLKGSRYQVAIATTQDRQQHLHLRFAELRQRLGGSALPRAVKEHAVAIFTLLAEAEAQVHDLPTEEVVFHEVGAWDSIADIIAAAFLIDALAVKSWSVSTLPLGSGQVHGAHGSLPLPAPATVQLLRGFVVLDDGREGERVTPTGAAILKYLEPAYRSPAYPMVMGRTGIGFGTHRLEGIPNILRILALEALQERRSDEVAVLQFEVDDQTAEDLALGLEKLRQLPAVIDVLQLASFGKQGRLVAQIQILARPEALDHVVEQCFIETTTLGLRWQISRRVLLDRRTVKYETGRRRVQVKLARRPQGVVTGKAELRDLAQTSGYAARAKLRLEAEQAVLNRKEDEGEWGSDG
jgi:uncharacterized protein (TIGR00299 family) protein